MQRKAEFACVVAVMVLLWFPLKSRFEHGREVARSQSCQDNLKQMAIGFQLYMNDYKEHYPAVAVTNVSTATGVPPYGWFDALQPYIRSVQVNYCPNAPHKKKQSGWEEPHDKPGLTDYWFNRNLAGISRKQLGRASFTIVAGDGNDGTENTNARFSRNALPPNYSPARRHLNGANYAFADGHVKRVSPFEIKSAPAAMGNYTFAIR